MYLLAFIVSDEKLFVNFYRIPSYGWVIFLCYLPNFIFVFQCFDSDISGFGSLCVSPSWVSLSFLDVQTNGFHHPGWDILNHISSHFSPAPFYPASPDIPITHMLLFLVVSHMLENAHFSSCFLNISSWWIQFKLDLFCNSNTLLSCFCKIFIWSL